MDGASLNAVGIIALAVIAAAAPIIGGRGTRVESRWAAAVLFGVGSAFLGAAARMHKCDAGDPLWQWVVGAASAASVMLFVKPVWLRVPGALLVGATGVVLSFHMVELIHSSGLTGSGDDIRWMHTSSLTGQIKSSVDEMESWSREDEREYPAGWVHEFGTPVPFTPDPRTGMLGSKVEYVPLWHTWLTGIRAYRVDERFYGVWFPGGKLRDAIPGMEVRELPADVIARLPTVTTESP